MKLAQIITLLFTYLSLQLYSQEKFIPPKLEFQQISEGLTENRVISLNKDYLGYIWAGTFNGLNRYDGTSFETFEYDRNDSTSLPSNRIQYIFEDSDNNLWLGTNGGLVRFNREHNNFDRWQDKEQIEGKLASNIIYYITEDAHKNLWIGTEKGFSKFDAKRKKFENFNIEHLYPETVPDNVDYVEFDNKGRLWLGIQTGINIYLPDEGKIVIPKGLDGQPLETGRTEDILFDSKGNIWIATSGKGLLHLNEQDDAIFEVSSFTHDPTDKNSLAKNVVLNVMEDSEGRIWVGTENGGLCLYNPNTRNFHTYAHDPTDATSIKSNSIYNMLEDAEGRLWLGSNNTGLNLYDPYNRKFYHERRNPAQSNGLKHNAIMAFLEHENKLWIGSDGGGITIWDREKNTYEYLGHDAFDNKSLGSNAVLSIHKSKDGSIWVGTWAGGLNLYNPITKKFERYLNNPNNQHAIHSNNIFSVVEDKHGNIWAASFGAGVSKLNRKTGKFSLIGSDKRKENSLSSVYVNQIIFDKKNQLWAATEEGLSRIKFQENGNYQVKKFLESKEDSTSISSKRVKFTYEDSKGRIWIGTDAGLNLYISDGEGFKIFDKTDGLPDNAIRGMVEDKLGNFWVTTGKGFAKMVEDKNGTFHFRNYDKSDGLQGDEYLNKSCYINNAGEVFLGGVNGFNYFNPNELTENPYKPNVLITNFKLFNKEIKVGEEGSPLLKDISVSDEIVLTYEQNVFSLGFIALNLTHSKKNQYAYMLEGLETDWNYVGNLRNATYTNLDAGEYLFKVKASNNDGLWNEDGTSIKITVLPPWWETWWFRTIAVLMVIGLAVAYYRYKTFQLKKRQEVLEDLVKERTFEVKQQAEELEVQRDSLHEANRSILHKNEMIVDSINYAKRIQGAILPSNKELKESLGEYFVIYRPKDIVSGDFYWMHQTEEYVFVAVVDCTGHGVPGACMSMMGSSLLNRIVGEMDIYDPAQILHMLDTLIIKSLRQQETNNKDGMDMVLCRINRKVDNKEVAYAGAKNGLLYYDGIEGLTKKIKGERFSVGGIRKSKPESLVVQQEIEKNVPIQESKAILDKKTFNTHTIKLPKESILYLTTDGMIDQNDSLRRRWGSKNLKEVLSTCGKLPVHRQKLIIENALDSFSKGEKQRDDIAMMGIKV